VAEFISDSVLQGCSLLQWRDRSGFYRIPY